MADVATREDCWPCGGTGDDGESAGCGHCAGRGYVTVVQPHHRDWQPGDRVVDGGVMGTIQACGWCRGRGWWWRVEGTGFEQVAERVTCSTCDGCGQLHCPDVWPNTQEPLPADAATSS